MTKHSSHKSHKELVTRARNEPVFAIDTAQLIGAGFVATALGTSVLKTESLDIRGILATVVTLITPLDQSTALLVGTAWHVLNGIAFVVVYAKILIALRKQSTVSTGVWLGLTLWILLMLMLPILFSLDPSVRSGQLPNPGVFLLHTGMGWTPAFFVLLDHLVYGLLVGIIYKHRLIAPESGGR